MTTNTILELCDAETATATALGALTLLGTRILVVEDSFENVTLLRAYLEDLLPSLDFAVNGLEALEKRRECHYSLILMDMQMPIMDGYTATREIRSWEKAEGAEPVSILALTAHALNRGEDNSIDAGCDGHVTKPVGRTALRDAIAKFAKPLNRVQPRPLEIPAGTSAGRPDRDNGAISEAIKDRRPLFLANRWRDLENLQSALAALDFATIRTIAHNCKGIGTGYGFPEISILGAQLSAAAKASDTDKLKVCLADFEGCLKGY